MTLFSVQSEFFVQIMTKKILIDNHLKLLTDQSEMSALPAGRSRKIKEKKHLDIIILWIFVHFYTPVLDIKWRKSRLIKLTRTLANETFYVCSGNIIAFLTVDRHVDPFTTLDELMDTGQYILGVPGSTVWEELFEVRSAFQNSYLADNLVSRFHDEVKHRNANNRPLKFRYLKGREST